MDEDFTSGFEPRPFGKYFLTERIAVGGMAEIYKAKTFGVDGFEKTLAIKKILGHCSADKEFITMLTDEAKLVVNLSHTNIVQVYDLGRVAADYFISMEYIDGVNLREFMIRGHELQEAPGIEVYLYILSEMCKGLDYAHSKNSSQGQPLGIVHRDISPQNILVSFEGEVKIVDFGIAKAALNMSQTNVGTLKGKVTYMSPEQALGRPIDHRTDIFSCGIILYELITGRRLFRGDNQLEVLEKIRTTRITAESLPESISEDVLPILARALEYSPKNRYPTAADMQIDLTRLLYSRFRDFSPRQLSEIMHRWFAREMEKRRQRERDQQASEAAARQDLPISEVNLVHREDSKRVRDGLPDTLGPEADLKPGTFTDKARASPAAPLDRSLSRQSVSSSGQLVRSHASRLTPQGAVARVRRWLRGDPRRKTAVVAVGSVFSLLLLVLAIWLVRLAVFDVDVESGDVVGTVDLISKPSGAKVFLDGKATPLITPCLLENIVLGQKYKLRLVKDGYQPHETELLVEDVNTPPLSFTLQPQDKARYQLTLRTDPAGAMVFWNGKDTGLITPADFNDLDVGTSYAIVLKLAGYKDYTKDFVNDAQTDQILDVKLSPKILDKLSLRSIPSGAAIFVKGVDTGQVTPHDFKNLALPQIWDLGLKKAGYDDFSTRLEVTDGPEKSFEFTLQKKIEAVPVTITSNVNGAIVTIDDETAGTTPITLNLRLGTYRIAVQKTDYQTASRQVPIVADSAALSYHFTLKKKDEPVAGTTTRTSLATAPTTTTSPADLSVTAKLRLDSQPAGAAVKIGGISYGFTPILIGSLKKHASLSVVLIKLGYKRWQTEVLLTKDLTEISVKLEKD